MSNYLKNLVQQKLTKVQEADEEVQPSKYDQPEKKESIAPSKVSQPQKQAKTMKSPAQRPEEEVIIPKSKNQFDEQPFGGLGRSSVASKSGLLRVDMKQIIWVLMPSEISLETP